MNDISYDRIIISELTVHAQIGHTAEERAFPQRIVVSLELLTEPGAITGSSDLQDTVCWEAVKNSVQLLIHRQQWILVEELAESISAHLLEDNPVLHGTKVYIKKFALADVAFTAIEITRTR